MRRALVAAAVLLALPAAARERGTWEKGLVRQDAGRRTWRLYVPPPRGTTAPRPLVLVLHGGGSRARAMPRLLRGRFEELADRDGFLVAYPDGFDRGWNDGRGTDAVRAQAAGVDDVGFLRALLNEVGRRYPLDPDRCYACGISNGAFMSCRLGCELADRLAAVALVAGGFPQPLARACAPARPVSVLLLCGTGDPLVPFAGGTVRVHAGWAGRGETLSARATAQRWAELDGCPAAPRGPEALPDADPADRTRIMRDTWGPGREGTEVVLLTIEGGGHTWPGGRQYLPAGLVGTVSYDLNGCDAIWEFFRTHPRRNP